LFAAQFRSECTLRQRQQGSRAPIVRGLFLRGLTVINNDVIVSVGRGTVKDCVDACARVDTRYLGHRVANLIRHAWILQRQNVIVTHGIFAPLQRGWSTIKNTPPSHFSSYTTFEHSSLRCSASCAPRSPNRVLGQTNDNALAECKNGAIIRKFMDYSHIPAKRAGATNRFCCDSLTPISTSTDPANSPSRRVRTL
jgi:hypothetical protein